MPKTVRINSRLRAIGLDLPAQVHDVRVDGAIERVVVEAERPLASSARVHARPGADASTSSIAELRRASSPRARRRGGPSRDVRSISTSPHGHDIAPGSGAAQHCRHARDQLARAERLGHVVVRARGAARRACPPRSIRAVTMMIGTSVRSRSARQTSRPDSPGSIRSRTMRSGARSAASSSASRPVAAT